VVSEMIEISGDRVRQARLLRRLSSKTVSTVLGWSTATQTRFERSEKRSVSIKQVEALSVKLRMPVEFFTREASDPLNASDLLFRAPKSTPQQERDSLAEFMRAIAEVVGWLDSKHRMPPVTVPRITHGTSIADAALLARGALGVSSDEPISHLIHATERCGVIVVVRTPLRTDPDLWDEQEVNQGQRTNSNEKHVGFSAWVGEFHERPITVLRTLASWERTRWTMAHELGHLIMHSQALPDDAEQAASEFASELLAPLNVIRREVQPHTTLGDLIPIKMRWGISLGALIRHLDRGGVITDIRAKALARQLYTRINPATGRTWGMDEPGWDQHAPERPRILSHWAERCFGTSTPMTLSTLSQIWPPDVFAAMLAEQRRPTPKGNSVECAKTRELTRVVSLTERRKAAINTHKSNHA
jgi:Zn-dependent peptidase ImmA (M78 family)